jgi:hypothetical protein
MKEALGLDGDEEPETKLAVGERRGRAPRQGEDEQEACARGRREKLIPWLCVEQLDKEADKAESLGGGGNFFSKERYFLSSSFFKHQNAYENIPGLEG